MVNEVYAGARFQFEVQFCLTEFLKGGPPQMEFKDFTVRVERLTKSLNALIPMANDLIKA